MLFIKQLIFQFRFAPKTFKTSPIILRRFNLKICNIQNSEKKSVTKTFTNGYGSTGKLGEQNCSSWRGVFTVENLHEVFKGFSSSIVVSSGSFPISQAIFFQLLRVFHAPQMQDHFYVYEFLEGPCIRVLNINWIPVFLKQIKYIIGMMSF